MLTLHRVLLHSLIMDASPDHITPYSRLHVRGYWRASEASETLTGLFKRDSRYIYYSKYVTGTDKGAHLAQEFKIELLVLKVRVALKLLYAVYFLS